MNVLKNCWTELFILGLSQCSKQLYLKEIVSYYISNLNIKVDQDDVIWSSNKFKKIIDHTIKLQNCILNFESLNLSDHEYAFLKAIVLFSSNLHSFDSEDRITLDFFQTKAYKDLKTHISDIAPDDFDRFPK